MRREELYIADLVDNARAVREYLDGVTRERWDADRVLRDAVLYRMLLLGEIASAIPDDFRDRYPDVAWRQIRAFRNLAVHRYFSVDWAVVWKIAQDEPPVLEEQDGGLPAVHRAACLPARLGLGERHAGRRLPGPVPHHVPRWLTLAGGALCLAGVAVSRGKKRSPAPVEAPDSVGSATG